MYVGDAGVEITEWAKWSSVGRGAFKASMKDAFPYVDRQFKHFFELGFLSGTTSDADLEHCPLFEDDSSVKTWGFSRERQQVNQTQGEG